MPFIEASTTFYMGRRYNPELNRLSDEVVYYDSRDLTTHAVVVGMTGSGKTGLCITLLEEAILDNIPAIIIDPKGDITNLLLTFPDMQPTDFQPWVNVDDARRAGLDVPAYAADIAHRWREGLQNWGIVPDRVRWLKLAAKYSIYTPGSDAGLPISILASLRAPREGWAGGEETHRERINGTVTALLALIGKNVEPVKDREHVLIANIFEQAWRNGIDLTLEDIILQVKQPPFDKLGVFNIDDYMSERNRYKLAMELNNIIAAPSFQSWIRGEPLDIQNLLYQPNGRPRISIFYIAHLSEAERQFIITLLAENMLGWLRTRSGTTSLRALLYIDEMYGYFPPFPRNPPTKEPLLRLLKQARAFGVGLVLATQNPGDLDYKGLSNAGTWFIGRLQSENDRRRVMSGLESLATADDNLNLRDVERMVADIAPRVFLMHNVHDRGGPVLLHTRWAMSYLRGPLTRQQVELLMAQQKRELAQVIATQRSAYPAQRPPNGIPMPPPSLPGMPPPPPSMPGFDTGGAVPLDFTGQTVPPHQVQFPNPGDSQGTAPALRAPTGYRDQQPPVPSAIQQYFIGHRISSQQAISDWEARTSFQAQSLGGLTLAYRPVVMAQAVVRYQDKRSNVFTGRVYAYHIPNLERVGLIQWDDHLADPVDARQLSTAPLTEAIYGDLSSGMTDARRMTGLQRELVDVLYNTARLVVPHNPTLKIFGDPDANPSEFRAQATQVAREGRDAEVDKVTARFEGLIDRLENQLERKERELGAERKELADRKREQMFTQGEAFLSLLRGRTTYTLSRTSRARRYTRQTEADLKESVDVIEKLQNDIQDAEAQFEQQLRQINDKWARAAADIQDHLVTPYKKDIQIELFGIGWLPHWYAVINGQAALLPAF